LNKLCPEDFIKKWNIQQETENVERNDLIYLEGFSLFQRENKLKRINFEFASVLN